MCTMVVGPAEFIPTLVVASIALVVASIAMLSKPRGTVRVMVLIATGLVRTSKRGGLLMRRTDHVQVF
jgi:hypothetical protein